MGVIQAQEQAKAQKGNYESFLIALFVWKEIKDKYTEEPKSFGEKNKLVDLVRNLAHVVRNRLYDPQRRYEKTVVELVNNTGGIQDLPEADDPIWMYAFTHSQAVVGQAVPAYGANANPGHDLGPKGEVIWEKEIEEEVFERT